MTDCTFCKIVMGEVPSVKVYEDDHSLAFFDINPVSQYHTLVVPKNHYEGIFDIPEETLCKVMCTLKRITEIYQQKAGINNLQIVSSSGKDAQQDVMHLHFHIVPRSAGDGQDINWVSHPEISKRFPALLEKLCT